MIVMIDKPDFAKSAIVVNGMEKETNPGLLADDTVQWMWGDVGVNSYAKLNPLRWSSRKNLADTIAELCQCSNGDLERPVEVYIVRAGMVLKEARFSTVSGAIAALNAQACELKITLGPGALGMVINKHSGRVDEVKDDGQAQQNGVLAGMIVRRIDGQSYSCELLDEKVHGSEDYEITLVEARCGGESMQASEAASACDSAMPRLHLEDRHMLTLESDEQRMLVRSFALQLESVHNDEEWRGLFDNTAALIRYLRARKWNLEAAEKMIRGTAKWRKAFGFASLRRGDREEVIARENASGKLYVRGHDRLGRPVFYMKPRLENTFNHEESLLHLVYCMERATACVDLWEQEGNDKGHRGELPNTTPGKLALLVDFSGYSLSHSIPMQTAMAVVDILQNHYPERLGQAFLLNPPWIFSTLWSVISPLVDPVTYEKIQFVTEEGEDLSSRLSKTFSLLLLEEDVGGCDSRPFVSEIFLSTKVKGSEFGLEFNEQLTKFEQSSLFPPPLGTETLNDTIESTPRSPRRGAAMIDSCRHVLRDPRVLGLGKDERFVVRSLAHRLPICHPEESGLFDEAGALIRYLKAYNGNIDRAEHALRSTARWRRKFDLVGLKNGKCHDILGKLGSLGDMYVRGYDLFGRPIIYLKLGLSAKNRSHDDWLKLFIYCLERAVACLDSNELQHRELQDVIKPFGKFILLISFHGYSSLHRPRISTVWEAIGILKNHYHGRLEEIILLQPPHRIALALYYFVDTQFSKKIAIFEDDVSWKKHVETHFNVHSLESSVGGKNTIPFDAAVFFATGAGACGKEFDDQLKAMIREGSTSAEEGIADAGRNSLFTMLSSVA